MRYFSTDETDSGSIHAIGNGNFIVYGKSLNMTNIQGPMYTNPSYGSINLVSGINLTCRSERKNNTNTWVHHINADNSEAEFIDAIDPEFNIFVRKIKSGFNFEMKLDTYSNVFCVHYENYQITNDVKIDCSIVCMPKGTPYFTGECTPRENRMIIYCKGCVSFNALTKLININRGEGELILISSETPFLIGQAEKIFEKNFDVFARSEKHWNNYLITAEKVKKKIPSDHPEKIRIETAIESVSIAIAAQQSKDGGIMAGHYYPMAYVRDQAGTVRGLLALGYIEQAKAVLDFWYNKWTRFKNLYNAESMGHDNSRLMFTCDEVEVPAYVVFSVFEYYDKTSDIEYVKKVFPMIIWAMDAQIKHLAHGMTCFSGDETYIAGFTFPREFIYHGSAESTLLFIESGKRAYKFASENKILSIEKLNEYKTALEESCSLYSKNFIFEGILYGNNPEREKYAAPPRFHFGYCVVDQLMNRPSPLMWLEKGEHGYHRCPKCYNEKIPLVNEIKKYMLGSLGLLPPYYRSDILSREEILINIKPYKETFEKNGYIPSRENGTRSLGYDMGLLLYNLTYINDPKKDDVLKAMLDFLDETGVWVEYYDNKIPANCRCRPWESAINMEALIYYLDNQ